ncbi:MAG: protein tyrosine phosphatase [Verrucomicrobia bacterium]|nr:MAG: protein tyrosine phosphatase [Verrucomicrobiota bacterium]
MSQLQKLLFICGRNRHRSLTAERLFEGIDGYAVKSAGVERDARKRVRSDHIEWADLIFVMELEHAQKLRSKFKQEISGKRVICLNVPDTYGYMNLGLIKLLKNKLGEYLELPARTSS